MTKLVIVESPTKAKTLSSILGKEYLIKASKGHVRDLPEKGLGVEIENDFHPIYEIPEKSKKIILDLKSSLKSVESVILATDLDREGEAIAWHLHHILFSTKIGKSLDYERAVFHEITKKAVLEAFSKSTKINEDLFKAQQARRILDRLVGYKLSPFLWKKVRYGLSAGRVQSVAVRLIVEREKERQAFISEEYWSMQGNFKVSKGILEAFLLEKDKKKITIKTSQEALEIQNELLKASYKIQSVKKSEKRRNPYPPFKTSTLQQASANIYGFPAKKTMSLAQKLFEEGHITYHRTDSLDLSSEFLDQARSYIQKKYGLAYLPKAPIIYKTKSKGAQEAHEAIRPTNVLREIESLKLNPDEIKIYTLIWQRSLECQMVEGIYDNTTIDIISSNAYLLRSTGSVIKFEGWMIIGKDLEKDNILPEVSENETAILLELSKDQHFTQPPARYSDASLIKRLEELEIGRPSTYAPTISTIQTRGYVIKDPKYFVPQDVAFVVIDLLENHFKNIVDYKFTAQMEDDLDHIAQGKLKWEKVLAEFYFPFEKNIIEKEVELKKTDITTLSQTDEKCPDCQRLLNIKLGKYGKFLSCSGYPDECKFAKPLNGEGINENGEIISFGKCENCSDGELILKQGKFGKFLACTNYPKCKTAKPYLNKIGMTCPKCQKGDIIVKKFKSRTFYGCSDYPKCDYASWKNPLIGNEKEN